jgi:multiple antibiotic resistance protein
LGLLDFVVLTVGSLIAVMEPFSTTTVYVTLTKDMSAEKKRKIIRRSMITSFIVLAFFAFTGHLIFRVFGITIPAFQIAGGILLVSVALQMLNPKEGEPSPVQTEGIAIVPLAFPLTSGPGSITTVILLVSRAENLPETLFVPIGIVLGVMLSYVAMTFSSSLFKRLGDDGLRVVTALMAIIVLAIAVQFILDGAAGAVKQFTSVVAVLSATLKIL